VTARRAAACAALLAAMVPGLAAAQAYQCRTPAAPASVPRVERDGPARRVPIAGYTLALSWSPEYCRGRERKAADRFQCSGQSGRFGFVLHGLWPEGRGGTWPQWCPPARPLSPRELARNLCMTPSAALLATEWAKHGACMARRPEDYFAQARALWTALRWPDFDRLSHRERLTAGDVRQAFADANPRWSASRIGLVVNERGWLEEIRLCYGKAFQPARCDPRRLGPADSAPVKIWRGL
jgi:ribonuclease T2